MSATTRVSYVLDADDVSSRVLSFSAIDLLPDSVATVEQQIEIYITPNGGVSEAELDGATDYSLDGALKEVTIDPSYTIAVDDTITIKRNTERSERYIDFTDLSFLDADDQNNDSDNLLHLIQEVYTNAGDALKRNAAGTAWNGELLPSTNCGSATDSTGWATLGQVVALVAGGEPLDVGSGIYAEGNGTGSKFTYTLASFPTTDITNAKIFVTIDGVVQRPGIDYSYTLVASVPTVTFLIDAPPVGSGNVQFRVLPGVVTTTYGEASIDGGSIIDATLDGDALIDDSVDGDKLADDSVTIDKMGFDAGDDNRFILVDAAGDPTLTTITLANVTNTGAGTRTDLINDDMVADIPDNISTQTLGSPYTWTNPTSKTVFMVASVRPFNAAGSVTLKPMLDRNGDPSPGTALTMYVWEYPGSGIVQDMCISFFVPPSAEVTFTSNASTVVKRIVYQEI